MTQIFIIGFGKFGKLALSRVRRLWGKARIWIIDRDPSAFNSEKALPGIGVLADGPQFLTDYQLYLGDRDWIIPSLPVHLAYKWLELNLKTPNPHKAVTPPPQFGSGLPFSRVYGQGLLVSYATFICPDNCPAPLQVCFKTKEKRPVPLWNLLAEQRSPEGSLEVIESRQLAPGIGGFPFKDMRRLLGLAQEARPPFYLATACRCHGIIHGLNW